MKLLTLNVYDRPFFDCIKDMTDGKGDEYLFIDWIPTVENENNRNVISQVEIVETTPIGVKLIIFDRYRKLTEKETTYLLNRNALLLEPSISTRDGFIFMPYWIRRFNHNLSVWEHDRPYDSGFVGNTLPIDAESILLKAIKHSDVNIGVTVYDGMDNDRFNSLSEIMDLLLIDHHLFKTLVLAGVQDDYDNGVIPDISKMLENGVAPLITHKHKWLHSLFKEFIIYDYKDILWYKNMYKTCHYGFMDEMYKNIDTYLPEMFVENFVKRLIELL